MWRNAGLDPVVFGLDARCLLPCSLFLFNMSWTTFGIAVVGVLFFSFLVYKGFTPGTAALAFRTWLAGTRRRSESPYGFRTRKYPEDDLFSANDVTAIAD